MTKLEQAIAYFEDAIRESDEIIAECSEALQKEKETPPPTKTPPSPAFHDFVVCLLKAREILGHAPDEAAISRIIKEVQVKSYEET